MRLLAATIAALLLLAAPAVADSSPLRLWSVSKVEQGVGEVPVNDGAQAGGELFEHVGPLGPVAFNLPLPSPYWENLPRDDAYGALFSNASGSQYSVLSQAPLVNPYRARSPKGTITHLDEYQAYEKRADDASLKITISGVLLQSIDANADLAAWECCEPVRTAVRLHARAYAASAGGDFFDAGGVAYLQGHQHSWRPGAATSADSPRPLWGEAQFDVDGDSDDSDTGASARMVLKQPRTLKVPLGAVRPGELFAVRVSLEAEAVDDRGGESAAQAAIQDPQERTPLLRARGLRALGKPRFKEPAVRALKPVARCASTRGAIQLSEPGFTASESSRSPMVLVTRTGGSRGSASATLTARSGSARAGRDFKPTTTTVRFGAGDTSPRLVEIPLREDGEVEPAETFTVALGHPRCAKLGARQRATVTIGDDDAVLTPPEPPREFTIGGTVDGLSGAGLVLTDRGIELPVPANGSFTLPGTRAAGTSYDVEVKAQPAGQLCGVTHGSGTVGADVTDVLVHCETPPAPSGLDRSFGTGGRVSTPVGGLGHGEAVVLQPDRGIVTAGTGPGDDFTLTFHDAAGGFDHVVTTDLGGAGDELFDAAPLRGGGTVAAGRTGGDFGVVRYGPGGTPALITKTDIAGGDDQANAVAVQADGKIVVAGYTHHVIDSDFAIARYKTDGALDDSFGGDGIVTTDLGTRSDDAVAVAIQPDGAIVAAGLADEDVALVRYTPAGQLDPTFGTGGKKVGGLGTSAVARGVALTPDGKIEIAGYAVGASNQRDFLLARYDEHGNLAGSVKTDVGGGDDFAEDLVVDAHGRTVLVGRTFAPGSVFADLALVRYTPELTVDSSFDGDGIVSADFHGRGDFGEDVALDAAGRIVAAGYTANGSSVEFALLRANP
jgi:uncharacterized delta-60 repeat protein